MHRIPPSEWRRYFRYENGKIFRLFSFSNRNKIGDEAGSRLSNGYLHVRINNISYRVHRIVWEMHNGEIPEGYEIDHINGVRGDNGIENLRLVKRSVNMRNRRRSRNNSSGFGGVYWSKYHNRWVAAIEVDGKKRSRYFVSKDDAISWRKSMNKAFGFSDRHGE